MSGPIVIVTRGSPLALQQTHDAAARLQAALGRPTEIRILTTTGDRQASWSLEKQGGKGLFTAELEQALLRGEADLAIHSSKDLPTEMPAGLAIAACLQRQDPRDVLVRRSEIASPKLIATGSPRRRVQGALAFPQAQWTELRGNVDTRLKKLANGDADASYLAASGLNRLGIKEWPGLSFEPVSLTDMVPAAGQGAVALQSRSADIAHYISAGCASHDVFRDRRAPVPDQARRRLPHCVRVPPRRRTRAPFPCRLRSPRIRLPRHRPRRGLRLGR